MISRDESFVQCSSASRSWEAVESFPTASVAARADRIVGASVTCGSFVAFAAAELRAPTRSAAHVSGKTNRANRVIGQSQRFDKRQ